MDIMIPEGGSLNQLFHVLSVDQQVVIVVAQSYICVGGGTE